ncbi:SOS response-associated peptidase [uncultured Algimonas sp.]|uniref:SOS response-associated peptidase n=1 Tax=uncultured Algimonas sp. TaxID=1547920 RepID=UPI002602BAD3|nr:SOS response-associated peptidase [uncultured Algimonas sp.]
MCGRYVLDAELEDVAERFDAEDGSEGAWDWEPDYNIAPTRTVPVIAHDGERRTKIVPMRWGLHPHWSKDNPQDSKYGPLFNARLETAGTKPSFRTPWKRRRALIPATHWYEWTGEQGGKIPWCIKPEEGGIFAFAGLWDRWRVDEGIELLSCTILTTDSDGPLQRLHHRMPVRLPEDYWSDWLDPEANPDLLAETRLDAEDLIFWEVGRAVGNSRSRGAELIAPLA